MSAFKLGWKNWSPREAVNRSGPRSGLGAHRAAGGPGLAVQHGSALRSEKYTYKLEWLACLRRYLDVHDPQRLSGGIMASDPERDALRLALDERLADVFRLFEPDTGHWSWWDYRSGAWDRATGCLIHKAVRGNDKLSDDWPA